MKVTWEAIKRLFWWITHREVEEVREETDTKQGECLRAMVEEREERRDHG